MSIGTRRLRLSEFACAAMNVAKALTASETKTNTITVRSPYTHGESCENADANMRRHHE